MRAALGHVLADAVTSFLAVAALVAAYTFGLNWLDPVIGLVGTAVIIAWAISLIRSAGAILLDLVPSTTLERDVRAAVEIEGDRICDLHLWRLGPGHAGVILAVVTDHPRPPGDYKRRLLGLQGLSHVTVEVHRCPDCVEAA